MKPRSPLALAAAAILSTFGWEARADPEAAEVDHAIPGDTEDTSDPAAVAVAFDRAHPSCVGLLIGPRVVVTAAHCVDVVWTDGPVVHIRGRASAVAEVHVHPSYDARTRKDDIAALLLVHPTTAAPIDAARWTRLQATAPGFVRWLADGKLSGLDLGAQCSTAADCGSDLCARTSLTSEAVCTNRCFPGNGSPCGPGLTCLPNEDAPGRHACFAPTAEPRATSSCHVEPRSPTPWPWTAVLILATFAIGLRRIVRASAKPEPACRDTLIHMR